MLRQARTPSIRTYPVEVSGWDNRQNFFVERCDLIWNEESGKQITLSQKLGDHTLLFVRLLEPGDGERTHPVVYEAQLISNALNGQYQFLLNKVAPRLREEATSLA
jgi:hypothetical protein